MSAGLKSHIYLVNASKKLKQLSESIFMNSTKIIEISHRNCD